MSMLLYKKICLNYFYLIFYKGFETHLKEKNYGLEGVETLIDFSWSAHLPLTLGLIKACHNF